MKKPSKRKVTRPVKRTVAKRKSTAKFPTIRKAKYRVGDKVYTLQNPTAKKPIVQVQAVISKGEATHKYRLLLEVRAGKPVYSTWIVERSIYLARKAKF